MNKRLQKIKPGIWQHYKGGKYRVIGTAKHSETLEDMVVYMPLYQSETKIWVRPVSVFLEELENNGKKIKRFTFLS